DISSVGRAIPCQGIGHQFEPDMSLQTSQKVNQLYLFWIGHQFEPFLLKILGRSKLLSVIPLARNPPYLKISSVAFLA
ncbi:hypothetical protein Q4601_05235, partial [Shewanella sp. 1_MG-2023]|uniref:hypothetical protein n=1 Tax=unclassified Shewanella TaxID=196818 RepID=UPI0026E431F7